MSDERNSAAADDEAIAPLSDGEYAVLMADFADPSSAWQAYEILRTAEDARTVAIDGLVVVERHTDGTLEVRKTTDHSTRSGLTWGIVGGAVLGLFFPPSILGSAAALGAAGAASGKLRELHHRHELVDQLQGAIAPGHAGIIALVSDPGVAEIRNTLARADAIVESAIDDSVAHDIMAAAREAQ